MRTSLSTTATGWISLLAVVGLLALTAPNRAAAAAEEEPSSDAAAAGQELPFSVDDWREAGPNDQNGNRFRSCTIRIGQDGMLTGTVFRIDETTRLQSPVKEIELRLVLDGNALETTTPNEEDGEFTFGPVSPGIYSLIGQGAEGLVAYSFHIEAPEDRDADDTDENQADANPADAAAADAESAAPKIRLINSCAMNPADMPMAIRLIQAFLGVDTGAPSAEPVLDEKMEEALDEESKPIGSEDVPATPPPGSRRAGSFKAHHDQDEIQTTALSWHAVSLQEDGSLIGRVRMLVASGDEEGTLETRPPKDMRVFLLQEGRVIAKAPCSPRGIFVIPDLPVGIYSFVSVGLDGFAAMTVDVLPAEKKKDEEEGGGIRSASLRRVGFLQNAGTLPNFDTALVPHGDSNQLQMTTPDLSIQPPQTLADMGPLLNGFNADTGTGNPGPGTGSSFAPLTGGPSGVGTAGNGGFGGGGVAGGGGGTAAVPEIDPASSGVGLSVLIALFLLLIDLYRPRESAPR